MKPATELALVVAPPRPDLPGSRYSEGVVVPARNAAHGRREGGHGSGHVGGGGRRRLAHRAVAVIPEAIDHSSAWGTGPVATAGESREEARIGGVRAAEEERTH